MYIWELTISCTLLSPPRFVFLSREGLDSLSGHWVHQHALQCLASRGLAGWAQGCDICCHFFFTCWMLAPGLLVAWIPLTKIPLNLLPYCYHQLSSVYISFSFFKFHFFFSFFFSDDSAPRTHLQCAGTMLISRMWLLKGESKIQSWRAHD